MTTQGDIVFMIGADVSGLTSAGNAGERSLADLEKAAKTLERQIGKIGEAGVAFQREMNQMTGVTREFSKSARDSAAAFEAFDKSRAQVDNLRASIDPLFAASKRYEAALKQLDAALEMGSLSAREHAQMIDLLSASYLRADGASAVAATGARFMGGGIQQVGYQIQDFAVQVGAGTSATQAFAQQFPQMASAFGPWGVAIGTAAAILVPLGAAFFAASEDADKLTDAAERQKQMFDALTEATTRLRIEREMASSGAQFAEEQQALNEMKRLTEERAAVQERLNRLTAIGSRAAGYAEEAQSKRATLQAELDSIDAKIQLLNKERALTAATELSRAAAEKLNVVMNYIANSDISSPWSNVLGYIQSAVDKAKEYAAVSGMDTGSAAWAKNSLGFTLPGSELVPASAGGGARGGSDRGGGGGGTDPRQARIEALVQSLKTEDEITAEWYAASLEALNAASEAELAAIGGKHSAIERLEQEHQARLSGIRDMGNQWSLQSALEGGAAILGAMSSTNKQAQKAQAIFSAASALMSTYQGAAEELKKGTFGFASAAAVIAKGLGFVAAIKSAGGGGGGGGGGARGGGGSATPAPAAQPSGQYLNFQFNGGWSSTEDMGRFMVKAINQAVENGAVIRGARIV